LPPGQREGYDDDRFRQHIGVKALNEIAAKLDKEAVFHRLDGLIEAEVDDEILALHVEQGVCYGFNVTAARVWTSLKQPKRLSELQAELLAEFDIDETTCERELREILDLLANRGLVTIAAASNEPSR
jgi:hypothetical protein